tara:strand:+ start:3990 stop:4586 length:597 start_codon:yes stop_codon:yes gene_type:complete
MGNFLTAKAVTFLDVETICLDPIEGVDCLLSVTFITDWLEDGNQSRHEIKIKMTDEKRQHASEDALKINNYSDEAWADAKDFEDVAHIIAKSIAWGPLVAHNAGFDIAHITNSLKANGWRKTEYSERFSLENKTYQVAYPIIDTCGLAYLFMEPERQNLDVLREHLKINKEGSHDATKDTEDCRALFYHIMTNIGLLK